MALQDPLNTDERDWSAPEHSHHKAYPCRGCATILVHGDDRPQYNGWYWCRPCYREITELAMSQDHRDLAGQEREARIDMDRDDFVDQVRR